MIRSREVRRSCAPVRRLGDVLIDCFDLGQLFLLPSSVTSSNGITKSQGGRRPHQRSGPVKGRSSLVLCMQPSKVVMTM
jgi:hypothetical protein